MRSFSLVAIMAFVPGATAGCSREAPPVDPACQATQTSSTPLSPAERDGRETWFKATFGGQKMFGLVLPRPPFNLTLGFDAVLTSNRATRFNDWGVVNDPDCTAGDASTHHYDRCADDAQIGSYHGAAAGIVGVRKFENPLAGQPGQPPFIFGVSCASCHAGFDPEHPPADPNRPAWANIHPTVGNQHIDIGKIFRAHLSPQDPRYQVFQTWAPGTVDTTVIESDHINNPGIITPIFNLDQRPQFHVTLDGNPLTARRTGQGGEDDAGCERAAMRVFFNIGMCAAECMVGHLADGPGGTQTEIDLDACRKICPDLVKAEAAVVDMCKFMETPSPPSLRVAGPQHITSDCSVLARGRKVFEHTCASCHAGAVTSNDLIHPMDEIGTNTCRARTTNWMEGHIWGPFSSDQYKRRPTGGPGFYRNVPLLGIWATAPFFHNDRLGPPNGGPSVGGRVAAYEAAMAELLNPFTRDIAGSVQRTTDRIVIPTPAGDVTLPAGTPVAAFSTPIRRRAGTCARTSRRTRATTTARGCRHPTSTRSPST